MRQMRKGIHIIYMSGAFLLAGCAGQSLETTYNSQEEDIADYAGSARFTECEFIQDTDAEGNPEFNEDGSPVIVKSEVGTITPVVTHNGGATRLTIIVGEGQPLTETGSVSEYFGPRDDRDCIDRHRWHRQHLATVDSIYGIHRQFIGRWSEHRRIRIGQRADSVRHQSLRHRGPVRLDPVRGGFQPYDSGSRQRRHSARTAGRTAGSQDRRSMRHRFFRKIRSREEAFRHGSCKFSPALQDMGCQCIRIGS